MTDRHTLSKAYADSQDLLRAQATRPHAEPTTNVEIARNAKSDWQCKIAVTLNDADAAYDKARELALRFDADFPFGSEPTTKELLEATLADEVGAKRRGKDGAK